MSEEQKLDDQGEYEVSYWQNEFICIEQTDWLLEHPDYVQLTAKQALVLLAWLSQEQANLERLAEEQVVK